MDGTILGQGTFVASSANLANPNTGVASIGQSNATIIQIPSGADWLRVFNYTQFGTVGAAGGAYFNGTANADVGVEFWWQRGMAAGTGIVKYKASASAVLSGDTLVSGGFTLYDPSGQSVGSQPLLGAPVATTASTNSTRPAVTHTADSSVIVGSVVRMSNTAQTDVNGVDMVVGTVTDSTHFTLLTATNALATAPGAIGGAGFYRVVNTNPLFYPRRRFVTNITQAVNAQVSTTIPHALTPGQEIRFNIPAVSGMIQLNPNPLNNYYPTGTTTSAIVLTVVDDYNFTINIDTTAYTAFTFPTAAQVPCTFPQAVPVGENTAVALANNVNVLGDAEENQAAINIVLGTGIGTTTIAGPAGTVGDPTTGDMIYWKAGRSFSNN